MLLFFIIFFCAIIFNSNGYDSKIFGIYEQTINESIGRISYSLIYSMTGFFLGSFNLLSKINKNHNLKILLISPILIYALKIHKMLYILFPKFHFLILDILIIILFVLFGSIPSFLIKNEKLAFFVKRITSFTGGIYYMHLYIDDFLSRYLQLIRNKNVNYCIIIYLICYLISLTFCNLLKSSKFKYLFL